MVVMNDMTGTIDDAGKGLIKKILSFECNGLIIPLYGEDFKKFISGEKSQFEILYEAHSRVFGKLFFMNFYLKLI